MKPLILRILNWTGSALAFAGIIFVVFRLNDYSTQVDFSVFNLKAWLIVLIYIFIYAFANILLALAWRYILNFFDVHTSSLWSIKVYGISQLAKYVPGNIMHLASRQAIGLASGVSGLVLAKSSVWELGLLSVTASLFMVLILPQFFPLEESMALIIFVAFLLLMATILKRFLGLAIMQAFGLYIVFFIVLGLLFVGLLELVTASFISLQLLTLCGIFVTAWLVGLVTPGAPAGLGVRELILLTLLEGVIPDTDLLFTILLSRIVTTGGDLFFFMGTSFYDHFNKVKI